MTKKKIQATTKKVKGKLTAIASTDTPDRVGDSLSVDKWDFTNFNKNPVLQAGHDYRPQFTVGVAKNLRVEGNSVLFEPVFHAITPLAKQIKKMYEDGFLKAWSVGFIPGEAKEEAEQVKEGEGMNELLEVSAVAVPANAEALMKQMKTIDHSKEKQIADELENWVNKQTEEGEDFDMMTADEEADCEECDEHNNVEDEETTEDTSKEPNTLEIKEQEDIPEYDMYDNIEEKDFDYNEKPYPNEHACQLKNPDGYDKFRRKNCAGKHEGKCIDFIYGIKEENTELQSMRFPTKDWGEEDAKSYCKDKEGSFEASKNKELTQIKTEETNEHIHLAKFDDESGGGTTDVVNEHAHKIKDFKIQEAEDHVHKLNIKGEKKGMDNIIEKEGRVLSKKNKGAIEEAVKALNKVLEIDDAKKEDDDGIKGIEKNITAWNPTLPKAFHKEFDVRDVEPMTMSFDNDVFTKFFDCKVKDIYVNSYNIPSPLLGTYLKTINNKFNSEQNDWQLVDIRNWRGDGAEFPPMYDSIQLNSKESKSFLIKGTQFYKLEGKNKIGIKFEPGWRGLNITLITHSKDSKWTDNLLDEMHNKAKENNLLKGEKFALNGEFIEKSNKSWDDVYLTDKTKKSVEKTTKILKDSKTSRGMLFIGPPGTGKTLTGKVLMDNVDSTFIWVSSRDMDMVGPITAMKMGFQLARDLAPTILYIEDVDNWLYLGAGLATDLMKTEMDGIQETKSVVTVLTSNYPEKLPKALLDRPGRFHDIVEFDLPDSEQRSEMLYKWAGELNEKTIIYVIENTEGFSGAHMKELVDYAKIIADDEDISMDKALNKSLKKLQEQRDFITNLQSKKEVGKTDEMEKEFLGEVIKAVEGLEEEQDISDRRALVKALQGISKVSNKALHVSKKKVNKKK